MDKGKINRIIRGNGLRPENFKEIKKDGTIYVIEDGIEYELKGFTKTIIEKKDIEPENVDENVDENLTDEKKDEISVEEMERLKAIKKPRGWAFRKEFIDSEGNVYNFGKLVK